MSERQTGNGGKPLRVLMITEGTYPFYYGGVSTWCHTLLENTPDVDFTLLSIIADPSLEPQFARPAGLVNFMRQALWGVRNALENRRDLTLWDIWLRRKRTSTAVIMDDFIPVFSAFLDALFKEADDPSQLAEAIHSMYRFFLTYDFDTTLRSQPVWTLFAQEAALFFHRAAAENGLAESHCCLGDLTQAMQWLYHWLYPLSAPVPCVDVAQAAMAGVCTLVGVVAKIEHGAAFMLTEHGIYLRERYLAEADQHGNLPHKLFKLRFAQRMTQLTYSFADLVSPCCDHNIRWELRNGASAERIETIYYGVDAARFTPAEQTAQGPPVVVWVGRIDPLKDPLTFLRAAAVVHRARPDVQFRIYGSASPGAEAYLQECLSLRHDLGLDDTVVFGGYRADPAGAYQEADILVLSSVSEALPFVIMEAMLCEKPVVATAVGGVPEEVEGAGIAVEPRNPEEMGRAILKLVSNSRLRARLGRAARNKAMRIYSAEEMTSRHLAAYRRLTRYDEPADEAARAEVGAGPAAGAPHPLRIGRVVSIAAAGAAQRSLKLLRVLLEGALIAPAGDESGLALAAQPLAISGRMPAGSTGMPSMPARLPPASCSPRDAGEFSPASEADGENITALAAEIAQRDPHPIDALEITALLESVGVTDDVASQRYGAADVFDLAEAVLPRVRAMAPAPLAGSPLSEAPVPVPLPRAGRGEALINLAQGALGLVPILILLLLVQGYSHLGNWGPYRLLALSAGVSASLLVTNGFIQGGSRRAFMYLGLGDLQAAGWFLQRSMAFSALFVIAIGLGGLWLISRLVSLDPGDLLVWALAYGAFSVIWLVATGLTLIRQPFWMPAALIGGLISAFVADRILSLVWTMHLAAGTVLGFAAAISIMLAAQARHYQRGGAQGRKRPVRLPSLGYLLLEAAPLFAYGSLYMVFIFTPHALGWLSVLRLGQSPMQVLTSLEVGLLLSMPPIIILGGAAGYWLKLFWRHLSAELSATPGNNAARFDQCLGQVYRRHRWQFGVALTLLSLADYGAFRLALDSGYLPAVLGLPNTGPVLFTFVASLIAYWLLGLGVLNAMYCITLDRAGLPARAAALAIVVTVVAGVPLCLLGGFIYSAIAFIFGAATFFAVSQWMTDRVMKYLGYHYLSSQ